MARKPGRQVGRFIRAKRLERGIRSARVLAAKARLSHSHVSTCERGDFVPRGATAERLAKALGLCKDERAQFFSLIAAARSPPDMRDELAGPPIPDLVVWRHLPPMLYDVEHHYEGLVSVNPDRVIEDLVPGGAAFLGWIATIHGRKPGATHADRIYKYLDQAYRTTQKQNRQSDPDTPVFVTEAVSASMELPHAWRSLLFSSPSRTRKAVSALAKWRYYRRISYGAPGLLTFDLNDPEQHELWFVRDVRRDLVVSIHDMLTLYVMWYRLALEKRFAEPPQLHIHGPSSPPRLRQFLALNEDDIRDDLRISDHDDLDQRISVINRFEEYSSLGCEALFVTRVVGCPPVAECLFGPHWRADLNAAREQLPRFARVMSEARAAAAIPAHGL